MSEHLCHALRCKEEVPEIMFMCKRHWNMTTAAERRELLAAYVPGQEIRKDPREEYVRVAIGIINAVADRQGVPYGTLP